MMCTVMFGLLLLYASSVQPTKRADVIKELSNRIVNELHRKQKLLRYEETGIASSPPWRRNLLKGNKDSIMASAQLKRVGRDGYQQKKIIDTQYINRKDVSNRNPSDDGYNSNGQRAYSNYGDAAARNRAFYRDHTASVVQQLKDDITRNFVEILYDNLKKNSNNDILKKRLLNKVRNNQQREMSDNGVLDEFSSRRISQPEGPVGTTGKALLRGTPGMWGRDMESAPSEPHWPPASFGKKEDVETQLRELYKKALHGPPGVWGKELLGSKRVVANAGPPGLWGRRNVVESVQQEERNLLKCHPPRLCYQSKHEKRKQFM